MSKFDNESTKINIFKKMILVIDLGKISKMPDYHTKNKNLNIVV